MRGKTPIPREREPNKAIWHLWQSWSCHYQYELETISN